MPYIWVSTHQQVPHETKHDFNRGSEGWNECFYKSARTISQIGTHTETYLDVPHEGNK